MKRMSRVAAAATLAVAMSLGVSAGPVFAAETGTPAAATPAPETPAAKPPPASRPAPTTEPAPATKPTPTTRPSPAPSTTKPAPPPVKPSETAVKDPPSPESAPPSVSGTTPATSASAPPAAADEQPDLRLTAAFDRTSYDPMNVVVVHVSVVNAGTGTADNVRLADSGNLAPHTWDGFAGRYVVLAPGQTAEGVATAWVADVTGNVVRLTVEVTSDEPDAAPADNAVTITAPLTVVRGGFTGIAYGDHNGTTCWTRVRRSPACTSTRRPRSGRLTR